MSAPSYGPPPGYGPPVPDGPKPTSTTGPKVTVAIGVVLLIAAIGIGVGAAAAFLRVMPTDVLRLDGTAGSGVVAEGEAPGVMRAGLEADSEYTLFLVRPDGSLDMDMAGSPTVTGADGSSVQVRPSGVSLTVTMGQSRAEAVASFRTGAGGDYEIDAPAAADGRQARLYVVPSTGLGGFVGGVFGGVAGVLGAIFLGLLSLALLVTGGILWGVRRGNARRIGVAA